MKTIPPIMYRSFVIVEGDPVVSMDLAGLIKMVFPTGDVTLAQSLSQAQGALAKANRDSCVFFNSALQSRCAIDLLAGAAARGTRIVFVGVGLDVDFATTVVEMPFNSSMVMNALTHDASDPPAHPPAIHT